MPAFGSVAPLLPKVAHTRAGIIVSLLAATGLAVTAANAPRAQRLIGLSFAGGDNVKAGDVGRTEAVARLHADTGRAQTAPSDDGYEAVLRQEQRTGLTRPLAPARPVLTTPSS